MYHILSKLAKDILVVPAVAKLRASLFQLIIQII
jgi:hypothetical protein